MSSCLTVLRKTGEGSVCFTRLERWTASSGADVCFIFASILARWGRTWWSLRRVY